MIVFTASVSIPTDFLY